MSAALVGAALVVSTAMPAGAASDRTVARAGVIVKQDVPSAWTSRPPDNSGDKALAKAAAGIPTCREYLAVRKSTDAATNAESRTFTDGANELSNKVWVFPNAAKAKKTFASMESSTVAGCFTTLFQSVLEATLGKDPSVSDVQVSVDQETNLAGLAGDEKVAYGGPVLVTNTDGTVDTILLANFLVRSGRSILSFSVLGPADPQGNFATTFSDPAQEAIDDAISRLARVES